MLKQEVEPNIIEKMFQPISSNTILFDTLKMFVPKWKEKGTYIISGMLSIIPAFLAATSPFTVEIFRDLVQMVRDVALAMFGIVFTGYAIFQALIGKEMLIRMLKNTIGEGKQEKSRLQETNELFVKTMMMQFVCIITSVVLTLLLICIPNEFTLLKNRYWNELLAFCGMFLFIYISFITLLEIKSFVFNIFQWFNFHAVARLMEMLNDEN